MTRSCDTCRQHLGCGHCNISMEMECRDGGGFEAWEEKDAAGTRREEE